jgi:hypothetical protein
MCRTTNSDSEQPQGLSPGAGLKHVWNVPALCAIGLVRLYQLLPGPLLGRHCRFHPSCSQYSILAFRQYGFIRGVFKTVMRIARCHPWHPGGIDFP